MPDRTSNTPTLSGQSRGLVVCTLIALTLIGLYTAIYEAVSWMWLVWSLLAITTIAVVATDPDRPR
jgi:hypothetical protein